MLHVFARGCPSPPSWWTLPHITLTAGIAVAALAVLAAVRHFRRTRRTASGAAPWASPAAVSFDARSAGTAAGAAKTRGPGHDRRAPPGRHRRPRWRTGA